MNTQYMSEALERKPYLVRFPVTEKMGPCKLVASETMYETKEQCALWHYNNMLEHDGIAPISELPEGTTFEVYTP